MLRARVKVDTLRLSGSQQIASLERVDPMVNATSSGDVICSLEIDYLRETSTDVSGVSSR